MIRALGVFLFITVLNGCGTISQDCSTLTGDRDAYVNCIALQGDAGAQYELGLAAYEEKDYNTAISWFKKAAERRLEGQDVNYASPITPQKYTSEYRKQVREMLPGHRGAQRMLADMYEQGLGVAPDPEQAQKYRDMINQL